jgi:dihydrofolate reductase
MSRRNPRANSHLMKFITLVAAVAKNGAIGMKGEMPWHLPDELRHFKKVTLGKPVLMGRKSHEAIGMALPGRQNIVISRNPEFKTTGCETASSLEQAIELAAGAELMIIGGGELYRQAMPSANRMLLTIVDCEPEADTWFPEWSDDDWALAGSVRHPQDETHAYAFAMQEWLRLST